MAAEVRARPSPMLDSVGAALSSLCLLHCLGLPLLALAVPALAGALAHDHAHDHLVHLLLVAIALPVSTLAFLRGLRAHARRLPVALAGPGFLLMVAGALAHGPAVQILTVGGGLVVAAAHLVNWRARRAVAAC